MEYSLRLGPLLDDLFANRSRVPFGLHTSNQHAIWKLVAEEIDDRHLNSQKPGHYGFIQHNPDKQTVLLVSSLIDRMDDVRGNHQIFEVHSLYSTLLVFSIIEQTLLFAFCIRIPQQRSDAIIRVRCVHTSRSNSQGGEATS
ncbi:hypothetical protein SCLCIDRAFT_1041752 [Scleroderma citrinum Foug A]|uniref:Uncharacterized protein n=1 Tax=Scleroderma citrinum Foug A TaxID=1036808 RepID=A0A0C3DE62_9AGAM|nr:hypothetical protein SCLCIDRAFT_1041752 [Scleroderma citrinum Foug A]